MWRVARDNGEHLEWLSTDGWTRDRGQARIYWVRELAVAARCGAARIYFRGLTRE